VYETTIVARATVEIAAFVLFVDDATGVPLRELTVG
jgi:hypothetical protein